MSSNKRQCISCRALKSREQLIRICRLFSSKEIVINPTKYQFGRSAYICNDSECINKAIKGKKIAKMLKGVYQGDIDNQLLIQCHKPQRMGVPA